MNLFTLFRESAGELRQLRVITTCGILAALGVALKFVASIDIGNYIRIGFSELPNFVAAALFGPVAGGVFAGVLDVLKYIVAPNGPFLPLFTLTAVVKGIIFGMVLYKKPVSWLRVFVAQLLGSLVCSVFLNTLWLKLLYGQAILAILPGRLIQNAFSIPINTVICYFLLQAVTVAWRRIMPAESTMK